MKQPKKKFSLALITGASSGIGEALSHLLVNEGIPLLLTGRDESKLELLVHLLRKKGGKVDYFSADLIRASDRAYAIACIQQQAPDLIINNAGSGLYGEALSHSTVEQMEVLAINATALLELSLEGARTLLAHQRTGVIMNVSSAAAFQIFPMLAVYASAKAFVNHFSQAFDWEMKPHGIRILTACPGMVQTSFSSRAGGTYQPLDEALALSPCDAAKEIWKQIQQENPCRIFDWKTRFSTYMSLFFPKSWILPILAKRIKSRIRE